MNKVFIIKLILAMLMLFILTPDLDVLKRFIFGFGTFLLPSLIVLLLAIIQYGVFLKYKQISLVFWFIMFCYVLTNIVDGWPTGLMVNLIITLLCIPMTFILALLLAIFRFQKSLFVLKVISTIIVEVVRGVPLIGLMIFILSVGADMIPANWMMPKIINLWLIYSLFAGVYLAEIFRGGFNSITQTYFEGAAALGFSNIKMYYHILIPKVIIDTLPAAFNVYIGLFKETSLVLLFGYFDLMNIALNYLDIPAHYDQSIQVYVMVLILFWLFATIMHEYGNYLFKKSSVYKADYT